MTQSIYKCFLVVFFFPKRAKKIPMFLLILYPIKNIYLCPYVWGELMHTKSSFSLYAPPFLTEKNIFYQEDFHILSARKLHVRNS